MDLFSRAELEKLMEEPEGTCISIFLPTHRAGRETQQDPIRFKNLLREAEERLMERGTHVWEAEELLEPARNLLRDIAFWRHQSDGMALFLSSGAFRFYRLPLGFEELVVVADHYHLKPLLPLLTGGGRFYVLALSQNEVRLLQATCYTVKEIELQDLPQGLAEILKRNDPGKQLQFHTNTGGGWSGRPAIFHGHEAEDSKVDLLRYFRRIDREVGELLKGSKAPLVLAGVDYLLPIYREASTYPHLLNEGVVGNPEGLRAEELRELAWALARPHFLEARKEAAAKYEQYVGTGLTSSDLETIVSAAYFGRVDVLFVDVGSRRWGTFDPSTAEIHLHKEAEAGDRDLLDFAAVQTLLNKGTVYAVDAEEIPERVPMASVFRY